MIENKPLYDFICSTLNNYDLCRNLGEYYRKNKQFKKAELFFHVNMRNNNDDYNTNHDYCLLWYDVLSTSKDMTENEKLRIIDDIENRLNLCISINQKNYLAYKSLHLLYNFCYNLFNDLFYKKQSEKYLNLYNKFFIKNEN